MFLRAPFNYDVDAASDEAALSMISEDGEVDVGRTQQQFRDEVDINEIVRRFGLTGELPENVRMPVSGDFTHITDFKSALDAVRSAEAGFMELPAEVRARFENDPARLIAFLDDDRNIEEARKLGLVRPKPEVTRDVVQAVDELAAKLTAKP